MEFLGYVTILALVFLGTTAAIALESLVSSRRAAARIVAWRARPSLFVATDVIAALLLGFGGLVVSAVPGLWWFIHGDSERYRWVISGPAPFDEFGGGPYQRFLYGGLSVIGLGAATLGLGLRRRLWERLAANDISRRPAPDGSRPADRGPSTPDQR